jgi:hypothetical protein
MSFSGRLYNSVPTDTLTLTEDTRNASTWFFHHNHRKRTTALMCASRSEYGNQTRPPRKFDYSNKTHQSHRRLYEQITTKTQKGGSTEQARNEKFCYMRAGWIESALEPSGIS